MASFLSNIRRVGNFFVREATEQVDQFGSFLFGKSQDIGGDFIEGFKEVNDAVQAFSRGFDQGIGGV